MLIRAIESVCQQTYENIEIIVIDDYSENPVQLDDYKGRCSLTISRNQERLGGAASRNRGAKLANGTYLSFLDDDDYYFEDKIDFLMGKLLEQPGLIAAFGHVKGSGLKPKLLQDNMFITSFNAIGGLHTNGSLIKKTEFDKIKFLESLPKYQDTQLHMEVIKSQKVKYFDHIVAFWNKDHGEGQITDLKNTKQHINGLKAFADLEGYMRNIYTLSLSERLYILKNKIYLLSKCDKKMLAKNDISYTWYENILVLLAGTYAKFKR